MGHLLSDMQVCDVVRDYRRTGNKSQTARNTRHDRKTVKRWSERLKNGGKIRRKPGSGRKPALDDEACELAESLLLDPQYGDLMVVAAELFRRKQLKVSTKTLSKSVRAFCTRMGRPIKPVFKKPKKQLTAKTKEKRVEFCKQHSAFKWNTVMFTDRCKFHFHYPGAKVGVCQWVRVGEEREANMVNHASCLNVYAGITKYGVTTMCIVAGTTNHTSTFTNKQGKQAKNITSGEYHHVVLNHLLPEGKRIFSAAGISKWYLQQDNDPSHKKASAVALMEWTKKMPGSVVEVLPNWPPNSPDLNPIENIWAWVQSQVNQKGCKDFAEFSAQVHHTFKNIPKEMLDNLFKSMKTRVKLCLEREGEKTKY
jgi:transposase